MGSPESTWCCTLPLLSWAAWSAGPSTSSRQCAASRAYHPRSCRPRTPRRFPWKTGDADTESHGESHDITHGQPKQEPELESNGDLDAVYHANTVCKVCETSLQRNIRSRRRHCAATSQRGMGTGQTPPSRCTMLDSQGRRRPWRLPRGTLIQNYGTAGRTTK